MESDSPSIDFSYDEDENENESTNTSQDSSRADISSIPDSPATPSLSLLQSFDFVLQRNTNATNRELPTLREGSEQGKVAATHLLDRIRQLSQARPEVSNITQIIATFKLKEEKLINEIKKMKELIEDRNLIYQNMQLSEEGYNELRLKRADELSTFELACVKAMDMVVPVKAQLEASRRSHEHAQRELRSSQVALQAMEEELQRHRKLAEVQTEGQRIEVKALEQRCHRLDALLQAETAARRESEDKAMLFEKASEENRHLVKEVVDLRASLAQQHQTIDALSQSEQAARKLADDHQKARDFLQLDKNFLQAELRTSELRANERAKAAEEATAKSYQLERKVSTLTDQLVEIQLRTRTEFDEKMEKEITKIREDSSREMESIKEASRDIADREARVLKEAKRDLEVENDQLRRKLETMSQQYNDLVREVAATASEKNQDISHLSTQLKMKSFELAALGTSFEEKSTQLRQSELELDICRQELAAHKTAVLQLETELARKVHLLSQELDQSKRRLDHYETLEAEIDDCVLRSARQAAGATPAAASGRESPEQILLKSLRNVPSNPQRRVQQAVYLASRLLETEKEKDKLETQVKLLQSNLEDTQRLLKNSKEDFVRSGRPSDYLVSQLREQETANIKQQACITELKDNLRLAEDRKIAAEDESRQLRERLRAMLQHREELESLKNLLELWRESARADSEELAMLHDDDGSDDVSTSDSEADERNKLKPVPNSLTKSAPEVSSGPVQTVRDVPSSVRSPTSSQGPQTAQSNPPSAHIENEHHHLDVSNSSGVSRLAQEMLVPSTVGTSLSQTPLRGNAKGSSENNRVSSLGLTPEMFAAMTTRPSETPERKARWHERTEL